MPVVAAFELYGQLSAGKPARQANRAHASFGSGIDQTHHFYRRNGVDDQFGKLHFAAGGCAEAGSELENSGDAFHDRLGTMPREQRTPGTDVVDVFVSIDVEYVGAFAARNETGRTANAAESAHRRIHSA